MTYQDAVSDLVRLWDLLPILVGSPWRELEPSLLDALDYLAAAETDGDRDQCHATLRHATAATAHKRRHSADGPTGRHGLHLRLHRLR